VPGGAPAYDNISAKMQALKGASGDGLYTNVLPHASAGATFQEHVLNNHIK
jgi:hypothetical protein